MKKKRQKFITAFDPKVGKRVLFSVRGDYATSTVSGHKFRYKL